MYSAGCLVHYMHYITVVMLADCMAKWGLPLCGSNPVLSFLYSTMRRFLGPSTSWSAGMRPNKISLSLSRSLG